MSMTMVMRPGTMLDKRGNPATMCHSPVASIEINQRSTAVTASSTPSRRLRQTGTDRARKTRRATPRYSTVGPPAPK